MLKTRVIPTLLFKDTGLVKGMAFDSWRRTGSAMQAIRVYAMREVDELIFLDISATPNGRGPDLEQIDVLADECFMPLTVGGGVRSLTDIRNLLAAGADKVAINTGAIEDPLFIRKAADSFGSQCIVVSIDYRRRSRDGSFEVYSNCGQVPTGKHAADWAAEMASMGAGEILLTSIERDGTMQGYDIPLISNVCRLVDIPVIASGGAGNYDHMVEAVQVGGAAAVAAASIFHFTEQTPRGAKMRMRDAGIPVRL